MTDLRNRFERSAGAAIRYEGNLVHPCIQLKIVEPCYLTVRFESCKDDIRKQGLLFVAQDCRLDVEPGEEPCKGFYDWVEIDVAPAYEIKIVDVRLGARLFVSSCWEDNGVKAETGNFGMRVFPERKKVPNMGTAHCSDGPSNPPDFECLVFSYTLWKRGADGQVEPIESPT